MKAATIQKSLLLLVLLVAPIVILGRFFATSFPKWPEDITIYNSLESLENAAAQEIYPPDYYDNGCYVLQPQGKVRYWMIGPEGGRQVVLIHGLSIPSIIWKDVAPSLAASGYRVLLYDLFGRGYSQAPKTDYNSALYTTQLALLMQHVGWERASIVGVSMGGGIAAAFTSQFPHLVDDKVALIASAGLLESSDMSRTVRFMSSPLVQVLASSSIVRGYIQHLANSSIGRNPIQDIVRIQSAHLEGYNAAISSSIRKGPLRGLLPAFKTTQQPTVEGVKRKGESHKAFYYQPSRLTSPRSPVIHGTADTTVPYRHAPLIHTLIGKNSELVTIAEAGHDLVVSHSEEVGQTLLRFLSS